MRKHLRLLKGGSVGDLAVTGTGHSSEQPLQPEPVPLPPKPFPVDVIDQLTAGVDEANRRLEAIVAKLRTDR